MLEPAIYPLLLWLTISIATPIEAGMDPKMYDIFHSFDIRSSAKSNIVTSVCPLSVAHRLHALTNPKIKVVRKIAIPNIIRIFATVL